jgi:hypothetical protein
MIPSYSHGSAFASHAISFTVIQLMIRPARSECAEIIDSYSTAFFRVSRVEPLLTRLRPMIDGMYGAVGNRNHGW